MRVIKTKRKENNKMIKNRLLFIHYRKKIANNETQWHLIHLLITIFVKVPFYHSWNYVFPTYMRHLNSCDNWSSTSWREYDSLDVTNVISHSEQRWPLWLASSLLSPCASKTLISFGGEGNLRHTHILTDRRKKKVREKIWGNYYHFLHCIQRKDHIVPVFISWAIFFSLSQFQ